jgi:tellurite resistance protein TehA-like permease
MHGTSKLPLWPLNAMFGLMPLWWVLWLLHLGWPLFGMVLAVVLIVRRRVRLPAGSGIWLLLIAAIVVSVTRSSAGPASSRTGHATEYNELSAVPVTQLMYCYGIPALLLFVFFFVVVARRLAAAVTPPGNDSA